MKPVTLLALAVFFATLAPQSVHAMRWYSPDTGRWFSRDPVGELAFQRSHVARDLQIGQQQLIEESTAPLYVFARNNPVDRIDKFGLVSEPDVVWAPAPCSGADTITAYIQVVKGYIWSDGGPHIDNGSLGAKSDKSSGCPLYPVKPNTAFSDSPSGLTGKLQFFVCRVCLEDCGCERRRPDGRHWKTYQKYKILSVGPCVYWEKGDKGDLSQGFLMVDTPNQDWQVGMDTDFPGASKGECFSCRE